MSRFLSYVVIVLLIVIGVTFTVFNPHSIQLNYLLGTIDIPLALFTIAVLAIGVLVGLVVMVFTTIRLKRELLQMQRKVQLAEQEVANLRAIPIKDTH